MENSEYGYVKIRLNELIKEKKVSKNKLATKAQMQRTQLNNYCKEKMQRVDLAIIARICYALDCEVADVLEYVPPTEE
jgi:putative transcriptional regulator